MPTPTGPGAPLIGTAELRDHLEGAHGVLEVTLALRPGSDTEPIQIRPSQ